MRQHCGIGEMDETSCLSFGCCWSKDLTCFSPAGKYNVALTKKYWYFKRNLIISENGKNPIIYFIKSVIRLVIALPSSLASFETLIN